METDDNNASVLDKLEALSEEDIDKLAQSLGFGDDPTDQPEGTPEGESGQSVGGGQQGEGEPQNPEAGTGTTEKPSGQALLELFQQDPEAQKIVQSQLDNWLKQASATADAKKQSEEFQKLVDSGDYEEIGRRFVTDQQTTKMREQITDEALTKAYGEVYGKLFEELNKFQLTDAEKLAMEPSKFNSDAEYVLHLNDLIATKKSGIGVDEQVNKKVQETLEALKNMKTAGTVLSPSPGAIPAGGGPVSEKQTSRSLIQEGFHEVLEEAAVARLSN